MKKGVKMNNDMRYKIMHWMDIIERLRSCEPGTYHYMEAMHEGKSAVADMQRMLSEDGKSEKSFRDFSVPGDEY